MKNEINKLLYNFFFFKQKTAYEMRISDWSSDVCSSDLNTPEEGGSTQRPLRLRLQLIALYAGGFLGPFGGGVVASILPEIGDDLGVGPSAAASSLTAYLLPFAALMLVSGPLGKRWGKVRTVDRKSVG